MKKGNLLIVDDESIILKRLRFILDEYAENIYTAEDGLAALEVLDANEIHCVVCDINMPKMNGVDVIKAIRKKGNEVPFIFYTAHGNYDLMMEVAKYGAFDFLAKPNLDGLEEVTARALKEGCGLKSGEDYSERAYLSEYEKLLAQIKKEK